MRNGLLVGVFLWGAVFQLSPIQGADPTAEEIVAKAITAHGGAEQLQKMKIYQQQSKGTIRMASGDMQLTREVQAQLPDQHRSTIRFPEFPKVGGVFVMTGTSGWRQAPGAPSELIGFEDQVEMRNDLHSNWLTSLLPLQQKGITIAAQPSVKLSGKETWVIKVTTRFRPDVIMYFDTQSHLLVKSTYKGPAQGVTTVKQFYYEDYKEFDKLKLATKLTEYHDNRKMVEMTVLDYKFLEKLDKSLFEKP